MDERLARVHDDLTVIPVKALNDGTDLLRCHRTNTRLRTTDDKVAIITIMARILCKQDNRF